MSRVRLSAVAGSRRLDLVVPDAVPLAELVPVFASSLDEADVVVVRTLFGTTLAPDLGLRAQHVADGAILTLAPIDDEPPPVVYDDLAVAVTSLAPATAQPPRGLQLGLALVAVVVALSRLPGAQSVAWLTAFGVALATVLALPYLTASWLVARTSPEAVDEVARLGAHARRVLCDGRAAALTLLASATAVAGTTVWR